MINERYYNGRHFIWAAVGGEQAMRPSVDLASPPSANPIAICETLKSDIRNRDHHSAKIQLIRNGIVRGANFRREEGLISDRVRDEVIQVLEASQLDDYWPLLYVIPYDRIRRKVIPVPISERAHPLSNEYRIADLRRKEFDLLEFTR